MIKELPVRDEPRTLNIQLLLILAATFLSLMAIVGFAYYGIPFYFDFMVENFGWSRAIVTSGNALGKLIVGPAFGFIAGYIVDRYGPRRMMMAGALFGGISLIGLGFTSSLPMFYLFYFFNALGYVFGGPLPVQVLISRWFDKNRGKAMGFAYLGIGAGGAMVHQISAGLENIMGWALALSTLGVIVILIAFPLPLFLKDTPPKPEVSPKAESFMPMKTIFRKGSFFLLAIGSMCSIGAVGGIIQHLKLYLSDLDFTQSDSAHVMSLVLLSSLAGRVLIGFLADIVSRKYVMLLISGIVAFSIPLLLAPEFTGRVYLFAVTFGIGLGGTYMIIPLMAGDLFGVKVLGRVMGIILVAGGVAESTTPMLVGALYNDVSGGYAIGFILLTGLAIASIVIISFLPKTGEKILKPA
jgi:sugar phosphate permease